MATGDDGFSTCSCPLAMCLPPPRTHPWYVFVFVRRGALSYHVHLAVLCVWQTWCALLVLFFNYCLLIRRGALPKKNDNQLLATEIRKRRGRTGSSSARGRGATARRAL